MTETKKTGGFARVCKVYLLAVLGLLLMRGCFLTNVEAGEIGVRYNNAMGLLEEDLAPGWHWEAAGLHRIWRLPSKYLFINYTESNALSIRTKDNNTVTVDVSIPYRIVPGDAWKVMNDGNHLQDTNGDFRFQRFAVEITTSVLREHLAQLQSEDFYNTDRRLTIASEALDLLNEKLAPYHLEANTVLLRAAYFRQEYESQLAQIQYNEQQKLLDRAKQSVADKQQKLDNYTQRTNALVSAKEQDWAKRIADLDRAFQVGSVDTGEDQTPGAARRVLAAMSEEDKAGIAKQTAELFELPEDRVTDEHLLGIKNIEAETMEYEQRVRAEADGISGRLAAEGAAQVAAVEGAFQGKLNSLLGSAAGRAYVAYNAAENVTFDETLTFQSSDGIPSVLRLGEFARRLMGR
jgi:regulator of protease activity HflC (stomatin/prohibitin superfamily)